jgi:membrane dipeptidase
MMIVDGHQDLAWNILTFGRDYTLAAKETRRREAGTETPTRNGHTLLGWPDYQRGQVALVFGTLFASPKSDALGPWDILSYSDWQGAYRIYRDQIDAYFRLADNHPDKFRLVRTNKELQEVLSAWEKNPNPFQEQGSPDPKRDFDGNGRRPRREPAEDKQDRQPGEPVEEPAGNPVGLVVLMEGAEAINEPQDLEDWWQLGLRILGPAWTGNRFTGGTRRPGPLTKDGFALLEAMAELGFALDISHMDENAVLQALDVYSGMIIASHANAHALLKGMETNRHLSDRVISGLVERDAVIGLVPYNRFLLAGWRKGDDRRLVSLELAAAQIDYVCQIAGDARHAAIGSDFDGGFGLDCAPHDVDTIADLQKLAPLLADKGYTDEDIEAILGRNWIERIQKILPED